MMWISPRKFKPKVKIPKAIRKSKEALSKEDIVDILNACPDIRSKTYVMMLASTGFRAGQRSEPRNSPSKSICKRRIYEDQNRSKCFLD
jgi:integrase